MRIDNQPPPISTRKERRVVQGPSAVYGVKPVTVEEKLPADESQRRDVPAVPSSTVEHRSDAQDRRRLCRRVSKQAVLIELRSGVDRRKHDQRDGDVRIHIDAQA
jgi:hypothetical protein